MGDVNEFVNNRTDMQKLLTIVVPVYKVEPYINKCLDSCLIFKTNEQGEKVLDEELMNQLEVIIVNDGTPDRSAEMSREYVKRYPQTFRQIDKENGGHGSAWNVGLKEATGKYLRFLDSDDWLINLDRFMVDLASYDVDLVFTQLDKFYVEFDKFERWPIDEETNKIKCTEDFPYHQMIDYTICNFQYCTYKTILLKRLWPLFDEHVYYDDIILHVAPIVLAVSYVVLDHPLYQYLIGRVGQTMSQEVLSRNFAFNKSQHEKSFAFYMSHRAQMKPETKKWASHVLICHICGHFVPELPHLPYRKAKMLAKQIKDEIAVLDEDVNKLSKQTKRLYRFPFELVYIIEKIRLMKNHN